jgi:hypothetical protein
VSSFFPGARGYILTSIRYSGVRRNDFPPLASTNRSNKYTPPARRAPTGQSTVSGAPVDPAIISSQLARPDKYVPEKPKPAPAAAPAPAAVAAAVPAPAPAPAPAQQPAQPAPPVQPAAAAKADSATPPLPSSNFIATPDTKATSTTASKPTSRTVSPKAKAEGTQNATATVERDVVHAFKGFAAKERNAAENSRLKRAKLDKESKLHELKKFAEGFKLNTPVPKDLVPIIAKDPAKQKEIQEKAQKNAEEAKTNSPQVPKPTSAPVDPKAQRPAVGSHGTSPSGVPSRQNGNRPGFATAQGSYPQPPRSAQGQHINNNANRPVPALNPRLRGVEQPKGPAGPPPVQEARVPPTGPALHNPDPNFSRRSSGAPNLLGAGPKLNPNSNEFRPNAFAPSFSPTKGPSATSSPRSASTAGQTPQAPSPARSFLRRKPLPDSERPSIEEDFDVIEYISKSQPTVETTKKAWDANGGIKPAYDTPVLWKQVNDNDKPDSAIHKTYKEMFDVLPFAGPVLASPAPSHVNPQVAHQHQLPFHLQQGAMSQRPSPRQPPIHPHGNQLGQPHFPSDDHRMVPSQSAQSFASPRLQQAPMVYPSPMGQHAQLAYNQPMMQFPMGGPGAPQMAQYRSYSGNQYMPQQAANMGTPMMMHGPAGGFIPGPQGMVAPAPQMQMYPAGQAHFMPQGNVHASPMMANGYPSPGRGAPMMVSQGSQQGQPVYGMSPAMQFGQPIYAQQQPGQSKHNRFIQHPQLLTDHHSAWHA